MHAYLINKYHDGVKGLVILHTYARLCMAIVMSSKWWK